MSPASNRLRVQLILGGVFVTLLLGAVFTMGSLDVPIEPQSWREVIALFAVNSFITASLLIFGLILIRGIVRLRMEQSKAQLGARFKTKMALGAMAISLLPIIFMFFVSYCLLNRTLGRWFPRPLEIASEETQKLLNDLGHNSLQRLHTVGYQLASHTGEPQQAFLERAFALGLDGVWVYDANGNMLKGGVVCDEQPEDRSQSTCIISGEKGELKTTLPSGVEVWQAKGQTYFAAQMPVQLDSTENGTLITAYRASPDFLSRLQAIRAQTHEYENVKQNLRAVKRQMLLILFFFTLLVLSAAMWVALFLAKQVTFPIQALAEGTREVSSGNFDYQVPEQVQDELGVLVRSFNIMTTQLRDSRSQIDEFTRNLQQAVQELERRRQLMETVLENIPAGVISLNAEGSILRTNAALARMFNLGEKGVESLESLFGVDAHRTVQALMRRALRMGVVSREIEVTVNGRLRHLAVTVSSIGPRRANMGYILVFDDLTEVLLAQRSAAWQEVARRIAHEIKNPLTPIQLSAQRLMHQLERRAESNEPPKDPELARLTQECASLIVREVATLASLVNEFSQFVRFPTARLQPTDANTTVQEAIQLFAGRLDGIHFKTSLERNLPAIRADGQLLRSVIVNLVDNAAEALEGEAFREIGVATHLRAESDTIEISVSDSGKGISPEDKDKLFLPHFSTKDRGTGLGLAISARIISEHGGSLRMEDNQPRGSRFVIEIPVAEQPATAGAERAEVDIGPEDKHQ